MLIGTALAHYRITGELGAGGMGEVWRATDKELGREVALQVLPAEFVEDPVRLERFEREARAVASLNDPPVTTVSSLDEADGHRCLTRDPVEGRTIDQVIPEGGTSFAADHTEARACLGEAVAENPGIAGLDRLTGQGGSS